MRRDDATTPSGKRSRSAAHTDAAGGATAAATIAERASARGAKHQRLARTTDDRRRAAPHGTGQRRVPTEKRHTRADRTLG